MIVIVVGTNGSGKSTAVQSVIQSAEKVVAVHNDRDKLIGHDLRLFGLARMVSVVGPYTAERATKGCDVIKDTEACYRLIANARESGNHVLYEGIRMMGHTDGIALWRATRDMHVVQLTTPLEVCLASIMARRAAAGSAKQTHSKDIEGNITRANNYALKLAQLGCPRTRVTREEAPAAILAALRSAS